MDPKLPELMGSRRTYRINDVLSVEERLDDKGDLRSVGLYVKDPFFWSPDIVLPKEVLPVLLRYLEGLVKP